MSESFTTEQRVWLENTLTDIIRQWQPSNADYVAFSSAVLQELERLKGEVNRAIREMKDLSKTSKKLIDIALEAKGYSIDL